MATQGAIMQRTRSLARLARLIGAGLGALCLLAASATAEARPWAGFTMGTAAGGVKVGRVLPTSPAAKAGLRSGDVIYKINGRAVSTPRQVLLITSRSKPGRTLRIGLRRGGRTRTLWLRLVKAPGAAALLRLFWLNRRAPGLTAPLINRSGSKSLASLRGKPVILYFWASWCDSCKLNFPKLKRLHAAFASKGLVIFSFSQDKRASKTRKTLRLLSLPFLVGHNYKNRIGKKFNSNKIPTLIAIDRKGIVRDLIRGSSYGYRRLTRLMRKLK
jgi:thiol-disulfide isomerase/thioredoxin